MQLPTINVILPMPHESNRGVHATTHESASRVTIRTNAEQRKLVTKWATQLGISEAEFMRGASYNMARALEQKEKDNVHTDNSS